MRLSYHLPAVQAPYLVPARAIQTGKDEWQLELLTGSTPLAIQQRPQGPQYAAWVRKWERPLIGQPPDFKYPRNGYGKRPVIALNNYHHKDSVFARLHKYTHPAARFEFWNVEEIYENEDTIPQNGHAGLIAKGYLCLTNQNIERKHDERFFFRLLHNTTGPFAIELPPHVREAYEDLIKDYQFRHDDEVRKRGDKAGQPIFEEGKPKPAFSRFVIDPYEKRLRDGDLVYVWLEGAIEKPIVKFIVPVSVPRVACDHRIGELLPNHRALHKCQSSDDKLCLCPACRVFGWVEGQSESGQRSKIAYAGRLRFEHAQLINKPKPESHTLAILSSPKPTTTRFYLVNADGYPSRTLGPSGEEGLPLSEKDAGYDGPGRQIRGRKFYRHHANGKIMTTSERTDQNRTIADALPKSAIFQFEVKFENMSPIELGALLWALEMPDPDDNTKKLYHRLGYGKPLGLGSVQITVHSVECLNFKKRYQSLAESGPINIPPEEWKKWRTAFEKAMADRYDEKEFRQLKNIRDLKALLSAPPDDLPIHYPRPTLKPDEDHPSYEWFMGNNRDNGPKFELPLAEDDTVGLPLVDKQGRWY
jgi:CRISPR-associated protein (TIGR03986 family)